MDANKCRNGSSAGDTMHFLTFPFCPACNTVLDRDAARCSKCGSTMLEWLRLVNIASHLRSELLHREGRRPRQTTVHP